MRCEECISVSIVPAVDKSKVSVADGSDLNLNIGLVKSDFSFSLERYGTIPKVDIGIICQTNIGTEYYLQVLDGYLITVKGCFIKVSKE